MIQIEHAVIRDSREQPGTGWFEPGTEVDGFEFESVIGTLPTGDYCLEGLADRCIVERKTVSDLLGCIGHGRERFERELARLRDETEEPWLIVEGNRAEIEMRIHRSQIAPSAVVGSLLAWSCDYRIKCWWSGNARLAERDCLRLFKRVENRVGAGVTR